MPPCSANRSTKQLLTKSMPPTLKPATHNQMLVPTQSLMRPFVLSPCTRDEKRLTTERKKWMLPLRQRFDIATWCYRGAEIYMESGREINEERKEREQCGHACCSLVYLSASSTQQQLAQQQEDSFPLNQGCGKVFKYSHTCHRRERFATERKIIVLPAVFSPEV